MNDNRYCLQLVECSGSGSGDNIYSYKETQCGTWVDGTPIYRKVIDGTTSAENGQSIIFADVAEIGIDKMIRIYGFIQLADVVIHNVPWINTITDTGINPWYSKSTEKILYNLYGGGLKSRPVSIIIEYTKN